MKLGWLLAALMLINACHDDPGGSEAEPTAPATEALGTARPGLAPSAEGQLSTPASNPMAAYTPDVLARYDDKAACLAVCSVALRCRAENLFDGGSREVGKRLQTCRTSCGGEFPTRPGYLEEARSCLGGADCAAFNGCVTGVLAPTAAP